MPVINLLNTKIKPKTELFKQLNNKKQRLKNNREKYTYDTTKHIPAKHDFIVLSEDRAKKQRRRNEDKTKK